MHRLPKSVFEVSKKMIHTASRNPVAATAVREAGWLLLASLVSSMPKEVNLDFFCWMFHFYIIMRIFISDFIVATFNASAFYVF